MHRRTAFAAGLGLGMFVALAVPSFADEDDDVAVVRDYLAAWNAHDAARAAAFMDEHVTYLDVTVGEPQRGRDAARDNIIQVFMTAAPDLVWTMKNEPVADDDTVAFEWTFKGTNTGAWGPETPATGKPFSFDGVTLIRLDEDKIVYQGDYYDALGLQKQLGWLP
ncbi:MAG: ester cyclase [Geminicoccaceae bacterium]